MMSRVVYSVSILGCMLVFLVFGVAFFGSLFLRVLSVYSVCWWVV